MMARGKFEKIHNIGNTSDHDAHQEQNSCDNKDDPDIEHSSDKSVSLDD